LALVQALIQSAWRALLQQGPVADSRGGQLGYTRVRATWLRV